MVRSGAEYRAVADAGRTRAAAGNLVANFLLLKSDGAISGFAKNGDAIVFLLCTDQGNLVSKSRQSPNKSFKLTALRAAA